MSLRALNPQQREAVLHTEGPLLLLAGAGSGKTKVVTHRVAHLVGAKGVDPEQVLAVTFTNKAAREMQERVAGLVGRDKAERIQVSTFHSLCCRILRSDIEVLGYKRNFSIYGASDQQRLIKDLINNIDADSGIAADAVLWKISDAKNRLLPPEKFGSFMAGDLIGEMARAVYPEYQKSKHNEGWDKDRSRDWGISISGIRDSAWILFRQLRDIGTFEPSGRRTGWANNYSKDADGNWHYAGHILCRSSEHSAWLSIWDSHGLCS